MPGSRDSRRLSKNATDLVKGVQHLRPRGSYDPLPPPGGYPLPASIRKKFSFSPELANLSQISLMLDFASSTQDLGIQLDQSEAKKTSNGTPTSLYVHYSLLSLSETLDGRQTLVIPQHSLSGISSASPARHEGSWLGEDEDTDSIMSSGGLIGQQPRLQPSRSLRRMHARDSLRIRDTSSPQTDLYSGSSTHLSSTESTEPSSPRTSLTSSGEDFSDPTTHIGDGPNYTPQSRGHDELEHRLVKRLADDCPNLFGTFFIIDLQLPDNPSK